ncbi:MAG: hypothetical protein ABEI13_00935 [Candidatus Paceibacteria bacterium]|jgi:excinuclease UvrABC nuclease subunit
MSKQDVLEKGGSVGKYKENFMLWPEKWNQYEENHDCDWRCVDFDESEQGNVPEEPGVYNFVVEPDIACHPSCAYLMYVGETECLRNRFGDYLYEKDDDKGRPKIIKMLNYWEGYLKFYYLIVDDDERENLQDQMITAFIPPFNDQLKGDISGPVNAFRT